MKGAFLRLGAASWLCMLVACVSPVEEVDLDTKGWLEVRSLAFTILGNLEEAELVRFAGELALFDAVVRKVTNTRIAEARAPVRLFVLRDADQARAFMPSWAAGAIYPTLEGYDAIVGWSDEAFWTRTVLLHEYAHYVLRGARRTLIPAWYDEGLSEYLAHMKQREDSVVIGRSATDRLRALDRRGPLPLEDLFGVVRGDRRRVDIARFYATSWAFVHYLNTSKERSRSARSFVARQVRGEDWRTAFVASFDVPLEVLEASFEAYVTALRRGARYDFLLPLDRVEVSRRFRTSEVPPAEIAHRLGRLLLRLGEDRQIGSRDRACARRRALGLFAYAAERDPTHRRARSAVALVDAVEGRLEQAWTRIGAIGKDEPTDAVVALDRGRIAARRAIASGATADREMARRLLERAVALDPESPGAHAALARQLAGTSDVVGAIAAYERARALGAWSPDLDLELASLYRNIDARDRAIALVRPIAADLHRGDVAERAKRLLEELEPER